MSEIHRLLTLARPVMSVVTINHVSEAVPLAKALLAGGLPAIEITLRTPAGLEGIRAISGEVEGVLVGAGTVLSPADMIAAEGAGAKFAISPGSTPRMLAAGRDGQISYLPAVATMSELMVGLEAGYDTFKVFPAVAIGGAAWLKSAGGPFPSAKFCPTGGINLNTAVEYLALPNVCCVGGSWTVPAEAVEAKDWEQIERLARQAVASLRPSRTETYFRAGHEGQA